MTLGGAVPRALRLAFPIVIKRVLSFLGLKPGMVENGPSNGAGADPILAPGGVFSHNHVVSGGSGFSSSSKGSDLRASPCTSRLVKQDLSAYWSPLLYFQRSNGSIPSVNVLYGGAFHYHLINKSADTTPTTPFPDDFRLISQLRLQPPSVLVIILIWQ